MPVRPFVFLKKTDLNKIIIFFRFLLEFNHIFDTFSHYTETQIVDKTTISPPHKVKASRGNRDVALYSHSFNNYKNNGNPSAERLTGFRCFIFPPKRAEAEPDIKISDGCSVQISHFTASFSPHL